ncbi:MAG: FtsX-like permease family protein [Actinomycetia bacterium]|nr:FtsX-like permease family protein [Actinomycetes bacterium]
MSLHERFFGSARSTLLMLTALITLVPLVACANIASLFLARAAERRGELAVRFALGASRWRVVRQLLAENLLVALVGGAAGLALTWWGALALRSLAPDALPRLATVGIDGTVLAFALGVSLATVPAFGILPALRGSKGLTESLKAGGGRGNSDRRAGLRNVLVVAQVALSLMLMIASGLFFRSYQRLTSVDLGFRAESLLTFQLELPFFGFDTPEELTQAWSGIDEKLRALPGTTAVGAVDRLPISGNAPTNFVHAADQPPASQEDQRIATRRFATEGFFRALGVPLLSGRAFEAADRPGSPPVVVINETLARQFFSADASLGRLRGNPLGRTLVLPKWDPPVHLEVVGVVADVAERGPGLEPPPIFYMAAWQRPGDAMRFVLRTEGDPLALAATLSRVVKEVHADVAVSQVSTMEARLADSLAQPRFRTTLVGLFALVSLIMAAVGLYGVLVCIVRQRGRELGIRLALGAQARDVFALIVGRGMALVGIGIGLGLAGAFAGTRIIRSLLFDIGPTDAPTFGAVSICLGLVALAACLEPAWRAMRIDPCEALRAE